MIKTTRIKYSQAPRIIVDDLSPQCDGVKQTFTLSRPVPEWAPYCLVFNGQLYTNTSYKQWFVLDADRKTIHTSFITPPTQGPNKSLILIVGVAGMEDLGVFRLSMSLSRMLTLRTPMSLLRQRPTQMNIRPASPNNTSTNMTLPH